MPSDWRRSIQPVVVVQFTNKGGPLRAQGVHLIRSYRNIDVHCGVSDKLIPRSRAIIPWLAPRTMASTMGYKNNEDQRDQASIYIKCNLVIIITTHNFC